MFGWGFDGGGNKKKAFHTISSLIAPVLHGSINKSKVKHACELKMSGCTERPKVVWN